MEIVLAAGISLGYLYVSALVAKHRYSYTRAKELDLSTKSHPNLGIEYHVGSFNTYYKGMYVLSAWCFGLFFPLTVLASLVGRFLVDFTSADPVLSQAEHEARYLACLKRIDELEKVNEQAR